MPRKLTALLVCTAILTITRSGSVRAQDLSLPEPAAETPAAFPPVSSGYVPLVLDEPPAPEFVTEETPAATWPVEASSGHVVHSGMCPPPVAQRKRWYWPWGRDDNAEGFCDCCNGPYPCLPPVGGSLYAIMGAQVENGVAARMALYRYDFCLDLPQLTPRGRWELLHLAERLAVTPYPLLIQPTGDAVLDAARRDVVLQELAALPFEVPAERVITAVPPTRGLDGVDAIPIQLRVLGLSAGGAPGAGVPAAPTSAVAVPPAR